MAEVAPEMVYSGAAFPLLPGGNTWMLPLPLTSAWVLAAKIVPAASAPTPSTVLKPVLDPAMVWIGVTSPQEPAGKTVIEPGSPAASWKLPTTSVPSGSMDMSSSAIRPVSGPLMVQMGEASPEAPGAYSVM